MSDWKNVQYKDGKYRTGSGGGGGASALTDLSDVNVSSPSNGQVLKYNNTTSKWENANESGGGGTVTDVQVDGTSVVNQQGVAEITTPDADAIDYDNQQSGLQATNMQDAIDELAQGSGSGGVEDVEVNGTSVVNAQNVAEITSYKEVTLAEYQALPSSKLTDNVMYCIKDVGGANQFPPLIYSFEEREVGVWTDGKPLYQKTINVGLITSDTNWHQVAHNIENIDHVVSAEGILLGVNDNQDIPVPGSRPGQTAATVFFRTGSNIEYMNNWLSSNSKRLYATLRYTKTTDTAGSGTWTTQGGYAHHYSTSEKVVGTWIDGKPLYEKTFDYGAISGGSYKEINVSSLNIDYISSFECTALTTSGAIIPIPVSHTSSTSSQSFCRYNSDKTLSIHTGSNYPISKSIMTIQYTKTTD